MTRKNDQNTITYSKTLLANTLVGYLPSLILIGYLTHWLVPFALVWLLTALNIENKYRHEN